MPPRMSVMALDRQRPISGIAEVTGSDYLGARIPMSDLDKPMTPESYNVR